MAQQVVMPKLGMTMEKGTLVKWLVKEGDKIAKGDPIAEVETDKVTLEIESPYEGHILAIIARVGDEVPVNQPIAYLGALGEALVEVAPVSSAASQSSAPSSLPLTSAAQAPAAGVFGSDESQRDFPNDLVVIGAGPGGYVAAIRAAQLGATVTLVERDSLGGTCLNRGCIPTKALVRSAELWRFLRQEGAEMGFAIGEASFDWSRIMGRKDRVVARLVGGVDGLLKKNKVALARGTGRVLDRHSVEVTDIDGRTTRLGARSIILATGTVPAQVPIERGPDTEILTTDDILAIPSLPSSIAIIGGGVIGCEMANIFSAFGVAVSIVELMPSLLPGMVDEEVLTVVQNELARAGVGVFTGAAVKRVTRVGDAQQLTLSDGRTLEAERVLLAVGRRPEASAFEALALRTDKHGYLEVDDRLRTSVENILAIGDITGKMALAHVASAQGIVAAENLFGQPGEMRYDVVPSCIFTSPEIAYVGLNEQQARARQTPYKTAKFPFVANGKALALGSSKGFVKIIADGRWHEILGVHIVGPDAANLIAEAALAMRLEATAEELAQTIHAHPTLSEAVMEAAAGIAGAAIHV